MPMLFEFGRYNLRGYLQLDLVLRFEVRRIPVQMRMQVLLF